MVLPNGHAVLAPKTRVGPARQRFARIPFAHAPVHQAANGKTIAQPLDQRRRQFALVRADGRRVPFRAVHVVNRNECRLPAHGQAQILRLENFVNPVAQGFDGLPLLLGVGLRHPRRLVNALHAHVILERRLALGQAAGDRRGAARHGRGRQRNVPLARQQARTSGPARSTPRPADKPPSTRANR